MWLLAQGGVAAIHLGPALPPASCGPRGLDEQPPRPRCAAGASIRPCSGGVYRADRSPDWCALTAPFHPLPPRWRGGGLFSVALSCGSPRLAVGQHPALWRPDFPRPRRTGAAAAQPAPPPVCHPNRAGRSILGAWSPSGHRLHPRPAGRAGGADRRRRRHRAGADPGPAPGRQRGRRLAGQAGGAGRPAAVQPRPGRGPGADRRGGRRGHDPARRGAAAHPGFLTDVVGILLLLPPTRALARRLAPRIAERRLRRRGGRRVVFMDGTSVPPARPGSPGARPRSPTGHLHRPSATRTRRTPV